MRLVLDTNVLVAAMRSPRGASGAVLRAARIGALTMVASPSLFLEYEAVLTRAEHLEAARLSIREAHLLLDTLAAILTPAAGQLWRPLLRDPDDEMVIEAAINGSADAIVTFETRTFAAPAAAFGIEVLTPGAAWRRIAP